MHSWKFAGLALIQAALLAGTLRTAAYAGDTPTEAPRRVAVMTMNMYLGANVNPVFAVENPRDLPGVVADVWDQLLRTNVAERVRPWLH